MLDSTVSGNSAFAVGGVYARGQATIYNSTIAKNKSYAAGFPAGLYFASTNITLQSTIISNNMVEAFTYDAGTRAPVTVSGSNNLIQVPGIGFNYPGDTMFEDPLLGPLQNNGGATETHALPAASPAINRGNNSQALGTDQRGFARVSGGRADIGAFESDDIFVGAFDPVE